MRAYALVENTPARETRRAAARARVSASDDVLCIRVCTRYHCRCCYYCNIIIIIITSDSFVRETVEIVTPETIVLTDARVSRSTGRRVFREKRNGFLCVRGAQGVVCSGRDETASTRPEKYFFMI